MAASPRWKVYRDGEYVASFKYLEDAACLVGAMGGAIHDAHGPAVWKEGAEDQSAAESYDHVREVVEARIRERIITAHLAKR